MTPPFDRSTTTSSLASALVRHAEFDRAEDAIIESLYDPAGAPIVLCLGAPGFGKSRLAKTVSNTIAYAHRAAMAVDPNLRPVARIEAFAPDAGRSFGWREGFLAILAQLGDRDVDLRVGDALDRSALLERRGAAQRGRSTAQLQLDVVESLRFHGTVALFIDEIEHVAYVNNETRYQASLDILKSIGNETGVRIVCTGSYEGLGFRNVSGQLLRRTRPIHLRRYRADVPAEYAEYARVAAEMLELIGHEGDAADLVPTLYRQSLGAIGTTADLLMRAEHAWRWYGDSLLGGLVRNRRTDEDLAKVAAAILESEATFTVDAAARGMLDALLGLATAPMPVIRKSAARKPATPAKSATRPGRRKLVRDLVGVGHAA